MKYEIDNDFYQQEFLRLQSQWLFETPSLDGIRKLALEQFLTLGFPSNKHEAWKYTNISELIKKKFVHHPAINTLSLNEKLQPYIIDEEYHRLVFLNGHLQTEFSNVGNLNITAISIKTALHQFKDEVLTYFKTLLEKCINGFTAFNMAFMNDGIFINVPKNTKLEKPLHIIFLTDQTESNSVNNLHNIYLFDENSEASLIEHYIGIDDQIYFTNTNSHIYLQNNAQCHYTKIQQESLKAYHIGNTKVCQDKDSVLHADAFAFGGKLVRSDVETMLNASGAFSKLHGLYLLHQRQHLDQHTRINHMHSHCTSREYYKGILTDFSRGVFNGQVYVHPHAIKTDTEQTNKNLLLSSNAEIDTKPQLEIYNDDVKCSHGATIGALDEAALFYFKSRGIDGNTAKEMLTYAFAAEIIQQVQLSALQKFLHNQTLTRLSAEKNQQELS